MTAQIVLKKENYCQIKLASKERILISSSNVDIKIFKLKLGGLFPTKTLISMSGIKIAVYLEEHELAFEDGIFEALVRLCLKTNSIEDLLKMFKT